MLRNLLCVCVRPDVLVIADVCDTDERFKVTVATWCPQISFATLRVSRAPPVKDNARPQRALLCVMSTSALLRSHEEEAYMKQSTAAAELCTRSWAAAKHFADKSNLIPLLNARVLPDSRVAKRSDSFQELCIV